MGFDIHALPLPKPSKEPAQFGLKALDYLKDI